MSIKIVPLPQAHDTTLKRLLTSVPEGGFYLKSDYVVPLRYEKAPFLLTVDQTGIPVRINVAKVRLDGSDKISETVVVPATKTSTVFLQLSQGRNLVSLVSKIGTTELVVIAVLYATLLSSFAKEVYQGTEIKLDELKAALFSYTSSRIAEHFIRWPDILPDTNMPRRLSSRLLIGAMVGYPGSQAAVERILHAAAVNTPTIKTTQVSRDIFDPVASPLYKGQEDFGGFEAKIWLADPCSASWSLFIQTLAPIVGRLKKISEDEVVLTTGSFTEHHRFLLGSDNPCSLTDLVPDCFDKLRIIVAAGGLPSVSSKIRTCFVNYPFDTEVERCSALGARFFDCGISLDLGNDLDSGDTDGEGNLVDSFSDGFVGTGLSGRFDYQSSIPN